MDKLIVITGPTGTGKSDLAIEIAEELDTSLVSGDSVQCYRGLDIGSAKTPAARLMGRRQELVDIRDPWERYSVADFQRDARAAISCINNKKKRIPVLVGGTGLYIKAVLYDYEFEPEDANGLANIQKERSSDDLYAELVEKDPEAAKKIHPHNRKRIIRALQILASGKKKSELIAAQRREPIYDFFLVECSREPEELQARIENRVAQMMTLGLEKEVARLAQIPGHGDPWSWQSMQGIGYREWQAYFAKSQDRAATIRQIGQDTKHLVKKQYTWFRHQMPQNWYDIGKAAERDRLRKELGQWLKR